MRLISTNNKKRPLKALWSVLWPVLVLGYIIWIFSGAISPKTALASNNYINNINFFKDSDGYVKMSFHTLTTFQSWLEACSWESYYQAWTCQIKGTISFGNVFYNGASSSYFSFYSPITEPPFLEYPENFQPPGYPVRYITYTAGNDYEVFLVKEGTIWIDVNHKVCLLGNGCNNTVFNDDYITTIDSSPSGSDYISDFGSYGSWPFTDTEDYYFLEVPTLTITYPQDNDEIAENFYIQGSFTQPAGGDPSGFLQVETMPAGTYSSSLQSFWQSIHSATSGAVSIWVSGLPASYYDFRIYFRSGDYDFYEGAVIYNIHIVNDLPFSLPPTQGEEPTLFPPVYNELICGTYYLENSTYETSTAMFNGLCLTLAPMLLSIGGNLTAYTANFTASNASSTGNQIGQSVVLIRSYLLNLNSFFGNFPVSQFLVLYLLVLILVAIIRLVKGIIHLAKPI